MPAYGRRFRAASSAGKDNSLGRLRSPGSKAVPGPPRSKSSRSRHDHRLVLCAEPGEQIAPEALAPWIVGDLAASPATAAPLREIIRQVETAVIQTRLREHGYRRAATARSLGITREALCAKLRALGPAPPGS